MSQRTTSTLTADELYTIAMHYLGEIEGLLADAGELCEANSARFARDDLPTGPWTLLPIPLDCALGIPVAQALGELRVALRRLAGVSTGENASDTLMVVNYHLLPLFLTYR